MEHSWNCKTKISMIRLNFINLIHEILSNGTIDKRQLLFQASKYDGNKLKIYIVNVRLNFNDVTAEYGHVCNENYVYLQCHHSLEINCPVHSCLE